MHDRAQKQSMDGAGNWTRIADLLVCPYCAGSMELASESVIRCSTCDRRYPVRDGVPLLARSGTSDTWGGPAESEADSTGYQQRYADVTEAAAYNAAYKRRLFKRMSTAREFGILERLLRSQGHSGVLLDIPCGGGRLSQQMAPFADLIIEADIAEGQVLYEKRHSFLSTPRILMTASAFHIPIRDGGVDGTVCCRLCHHLPSDEERERLVQELLRVSRRFAIMTFFDHHSVKNTLRRLRRPFDGKPPKMTMTITRVRELARRHGARLAECPALAFLSSGHRYALMVKNA
jgi:uncharacterized protein YbaR (Trm112 family)/SAM-dependent methyltransferase